MYDVSSVIIKELNYAVLFYESPPKTTAVFVGVIRNITIYPKIQTNT